MKDYLDQAESMHPKSEQPGWRATLSTAMREWTDGEGRWATVVTSKYLYLVCGLATVSSET
jgi:hypothetical protein